MARRARKRSEGAKASRKKTSAKARTRDLTARKSAKGGALPGRGGATAALGYGGKLG